MSVLVGGMGGASLLLVALVFHRIAGRIRSGALTRNPLAGVRTAATMRSDAAWSAGHRAAEPLMRVTARVAAIAGIATLVPALALRVAGVADSVALVPTLVVFAVGCAAFLGLTTWSAVLADRAARATPPPSEHGG
ncbi:SdpI family protein [Saccharopolyspora rhizosphaerae]|uniref:SdpI family protein n=1 Tax=Saccharopolyspora rhizosphaerae TaxID=2492662 RepID=A0A3R8QS48_9PSEU|nr:SdpI family protein [Saccharopolyspora rhizosphaerae]RRO18315.1 SdpI family protein [Saccharopolyspora rhizosphaerae]